MAKPSSFTELPPSFLINFFLLSTFFTISTQNQHPLDPLTPLELTKAQTIIKSHFSNSHHNLTFHYVGLDEPHKSWQSKPHRNSCRRAFIVARSSQQTHELIVDLSKNIIDSDNLYPGHGYPILTYQEQINAGTVTTSYPPFIASIQRRGLKLEEVVCLSFTVGWFGEERSNRVVRVMCYYLDGTVNMYMRPIEEITATVDLDLMKIVGFRDRVVVPVPKGDGTDYRESGKSEFSGWSLRNRGGFGPGFTLDGNVIRCLFFFFKQKCVS